VTLPSPAAAQISTETPFGCKICGSDPTHLDEGAPALYCVKHKVEDAAELCQECRPRATDRNHPPGMIFVGWGHGWQPCQRCGGSGLERTRHCADHHCELPFDHRGVHQFGLYIKAP
jgi:hypothetical protein